MGSRNGAASRPATVIHLTALRRLGEGPSVSLNRPVQSRREALASHVTPLPIRGGSGWGMTVGRAGWAVGFLPVPSRGSGCGRVDGAAVVAGTGARGGGRRTTDGKSRYPWRAGTGSGSCSRMSSPPRHPVPRARWAGRRQAGAGHGVPDGGEPDRPAGGGGGAGPVVVEVRVGRGARGLRRAPAVPQSARLDGRRGIGWRTSRAAIGNGSAGCERTPGTCVSVRFLSAAPSSSPRVPAGGAARRDPPGTGLAGSWRTVTPLDVNGCCCFPP